MSCFRIWILRLQWLLLRRPSVVLIDHDGEPNARILHGYEPYVFAKRFSGVRIRLLPSGQTEGACYVKSWEPLFGATLMPNKRGQ